MLSYVMTIKKYQGQSFESVGMYLPTPVFSHGQLYVIVSRVQRKYELKILIHNSKKKNTFGIYSQCNFQRSFP